VQAALLITHLEVAATAAILPAAAELPAYARGMADLAEAVELRRPLRPAMAVRAA